MDVIDLDNYENDSTCTIKQSTNDIDCFKENKTGIKFVFKINKNNNQSFIEVLASKLYKLANINVIDLELVNFKNGEL